MRFFRLVLVLLFSGLSLLQINAQTCSPPQIVANAKSNNIFSPEQEMILGELVYQRMSGELRFVKDPQLVAYLNAIGEKLVKHLPPTGLKFKFYIIDIPEANAFNIPGGYVFVSRKLIGYTNNEDELIGVVAHELGHAVVRHSASDYSEYLKKVLGVTQVGDRKDITEKYNQMIEKWATKNVGRKEGHESDQQLEADRIGLFAMASAGYDSNAFTSFFDRLVETKGKTGNWFSNVFGGTPPDQKRLREMMKAAEQLPAECRESRQANASQDFLKWQADIVSFRNNNTKEELPAMLWRKELTPKLRPDISHLSFSNDGKYFLAQDDFSITIVQREPLQIVFQIPANDAKEAVFTQDSKFVVFGTESLRFEKWNIEEKKPVQIRELVVRRDCMEHEFSPDGNYLACIDYAMNFNLLDTQTGKKVFEKKDFYQLSAFEVLMWSLTSRIFNGIFDENFFKSFFHFEFSPDSRFFIISRSTNARFTIRFDVGSVGSEDTLLGLDLTTLKPVKVSGDLKKITKRPFMFIDSGRILGMGSSNIDESGVFSFPEGKRLAKFPLGGEELKRTANPNYILVKPLANARLGVVDIARNKIIAGFNRTDVAFWNNLMIQETRSGKILLTESSYDETQKVLINKELATIDIPVGPMGKPFAATVSDNFQWLIASSKSRAGFWNLSTGERKMHVRGIRGAAVGNNGIGVADFPAQDDTKHSLVLMNPVNNTAEQMREIPERGAKQYGRFVLIRKTLKVEKKKEKSDKEKATSEDTTDGIEESNQPLNREVRFELRDVVNDKVVWTRDFLKEAPGFFFHESSGRLIFYWTLGSEVGKNKLKEDTAFAAKAKELGNRDDDYLLEIIDAYAAKTIGTMLMETGKGSFDIKSCISEGNWLAITDSNNRVLIYSINDGALKQRFFGANALLSPVKNQILVENYPGELTLYDLNTGEEQTRILIKGDVIYSGFSVDGKRLFVLSDEQIAYAFDMEKLSNKAAVTTSQE